MSTTAPKRNGTPPAHDDFPVESFKDAARHLRRPFTEAAVKFRLLEVKSTQRGNRGTVAAYIDARLVAERLNLVCPQLWIDAYEPVPGGMRCAITLDGLERSDVGWSRGVGTDMDLKALYSDAFKRAAVKFGVGVSLYAIPGLVVWEGDKHMRTWDRSGKLQGALTPQGEAMLRNRYVQWLDQHGRQAFGEPLDHGDVIGDQPVETEVPAGVDATTGEVAPEPPRPKPQEVDTALEVVREAKPKLPKGKLGMLLRAHGATTTDTVPLALASMTPEGLVAFVQDIAATVAASEVAA